jgi:hypothetical protein
MLNLPPDVLLHIVASLSPGDRKTLAQCNRDLHNASCAEAWWTAGCDQDLDPELREWSSFYKISVESEDHAASCARWLRRHRFRTPSLDIYDDYEGTVVEGLRDAGTLAHLRCLRLSFDEGLAGNVAPLVDAPQLRSLVFSIRSGPAEYVHPFPVLPNLRRLYMGCIDIDLPLVLSRRESPGRRGRRRTHVKPPRNRPEALPFAVPGLRELDLIDHEWCSAEELSDAIAGLTQLTRLSFETHEADPHLGDAVIHLGSLPPSLRSLTLHNHSVDAWCEIHLSDEFPEDLDLTRLPHLRHLDIWGVYLITHRALTAQLDGLRRLTAFTSRYCVFEEVRDGQDDQGVPMRYAFRLVPALLGLETLELHVSSPEKVDLLDLPRSLTRLTLHIDNDDVLRPHPLTVGSGPGGVDLDLSALPALMHLHITGAELGGEVEQLHAQLQALRDRGADVRIEDEHIL